MIRRLMISAIALLSAMPVYASTMGNAYKMNENKRGPEYYISYSEGDDTTGTGSRQNPWKTWSGAGLNASGALEPGSTVYFKKGDTWTGSDAIVEIDSRGRRSRWIIVDAYGTGDDPVLRVATAYSGTWSNYAGNVYMTDSTFSYDPEFVVEEISGTKTVLRRKKNNSSDHDKDDLIQGTSAYDSGTDKIYVWCTDDGDPSDDTIYVPVEADGDNWTKTGGFYTQPAAGYICVRDLTVQMSEEAGFASNSPYVYFEDCIAQYCGSAGFYFYHNIDAATWGFDYGADYNKALNCIAQYTCHAESQGLTVESAHTWLIGCESYQAEMAGYDFLGYSERTASDSNGAIDCVSYQDGQRPDSYDPGFYVDGSTNIIFVNCIQAEAGWWPATGEYQNEEYHPGFAVSSEHPVDSPVGAVTIHNCLSYGQNDTALSSSGTAAGEVPTLTVTNSTFVRGYRSGTKKRPYRTVKWGDFSLSSGLTFNYNVIDGDGFEWLNPGNKGLQSSYTGDYNVIYGDSVPADWALVDRNGDDTAEATSFAEWKAWTSQDAHSAEDDMGGDFGDTGGTHGQFVITQTIADYVSLSASQVGYQYDFDDSAYRLDAYTGLIPVRQ